MKKNKHLAQILLSATIFLGAVVGFSGLAHAQTQYQYTPLATIPIGTTGQNLTTANTPVNPADYVNNLYVFAFSVATVIAVVTGVWTGVQWMFGGDSPSKIESAKKRLEGVGWGFALLLCSYTILYVINPQLVTFNLNLGVIKTANLQNNLTAQQSQMLVLQAAANTATAQSQNDQQLATAAVNAAQQAQTTVQNDQTTLKTLKDQLAALGPISNPPTAAQVAAGQAVLTAQQTLATDQAAAATAQTTAATAQTKAIQSASVATVNQITADIQKYANNPNNNSDSVTAANSQAALSIFDQKMKDEANQASAIGNTALASQIDAQRISTDSSAKQTMELTPIIAAIQNPDQNSEVASAAFIASIQQTRKDIIAAYDTTDRLYAAGQAASASALGVTIGANLKSLDAASVSYYGCTADKVTYVGNGVMTFKCSQ